MKDKLINQTGHEGEINDEVLQEETIFDKISENIKGQAVAIVKKKQGLTSTVDLECGTFTFTSELEFRSNLDTIARTFKGGIYKVYVKTMQGKFAPGIPVPLFYTYADTGEAPQAIQAPNITVNPPETKNDNDNTSYLKTLIELEKAKADRYMDMLLKNEQDRAKRDLEVQQFYSQQITNMQNQFTNFLMASKQKEDTRDSIKMIKDLKDAGLLPEMNAKQGLTGTDIKELILTGLNLGLKKGEGELPPENEGGLLKEISGIVKAVSDIFETRSKMLGQQAQGALVKDRITEIKKVPLPNKSGTEVLSEEGVDTKIKPDLKNEVEEVVFKEGIILENFCNHDVNVKAVADAILKRIPEAYDKKLVEWLKAEPNRIYEILPALANNKQWTEELRQTVIQALTPEPEAEIGEIKDDKDKK